MYKILYIVPTFLFASVLSLSINMSDYKKYDDISVYEKRLEDFNNEHGTNYEIPSESITGNHQEQVDFFTSMTLKEFDKYIMSLYDGSFYDTPQALEEPTVDLPNDIKENAVTSPIPPIN